MPPLPLVRWQFFDGTDTYELHLNPADDETPIPQKTISEEGVTAPGGRTMLFEGSRKPARRRISGVILEEAHLDALTEWYDKSQQIRVTDDLGREDWYWFETFVPKRGRRIEHPWRHTFEATLVLLVGWDP